METTTRLTHEEQKVKHYELGVWARRQNLWPNVAEGLPAPYRDDFRQGWKDEHEEQKFSSFKDVMESSPVKRRNKPG